MKKMIRAKFNNLAKSETKNIENGKIENLTV